MPKIPKMPIDMRMLTYYHEALEDNNEQSDRSNLSSAESVNSRLNRNMASSLDSIDTVGHKQNHQQQQQHNGTDHVFKPFKKEKSKEKSQFSDDEGDEAQADQGAKVDAAASAANKDLNSFFMTQIDQDETQTNHKDSNATQDSLGQKSSKDKKESSSNAHANHPYEFLFNIDNDEKIKIPKDIGANVRALKHMLEHPLVLRDPVSELDKPQAPYRTIHKVCIH